MLFQHGHGSMLNSVEHGESAAWPPPRANCRRFGPPPPLCGSSGPDAIAACVWLVLLFLPCCALCWFVFVPAARRKGSITKCRWCWLTFAGWSCCPCRPVLNCTLGNSLDPDHGHRACSLRAMLEGNHRRPRPAGFDVDLGLLPAGHPLGGRQFNSESAARSAKRSAGRKALVSPRVARSREYADRGGCRVLCVLTADSFLHGLCVAAAAVVRRPASRNWSSSPRRHY